MTERALLAGGAGFVGLHLARELLERGWRVTVVDDFSRGRRDRCLEELLEGEAELVEHDLTRPLGRGVAERPDLVVHLAAVVGVGNVSSAPAAVLRTNLLTLDNVLAWSLEAGAGSFAFSSTSEIADAAVAMGLAPVPVDEEAPFVCPDLGAPRASYALSKAGGEMLVRATAARERLPATIVRFFNVYGPRMGSAHAIPELIERALAGGDRVDVFGVEPTRAFCYVEDAVRALLELVPLAAPEPLPVNVGNDREEIAIGELARKILALTGSEAELVPRPAPPGSPRRRCPDLGRLRSLTGFEPRVPLDVGLRRTIDRYAAVA